MDSTLMCASFAQTKGKTGKLASETTISKGAGKSSVEVN